MYKIWDYSGSFCVASYSFCPLHSSSLYTQPPALSCSLHLRTFVLWYAPHLASATQSYNFFKPQLKRLQQQSPIHFSFLHQLISLPFSCQHFIQASLVTFITVHTVHVTDSSVSQTALGTGTVPYIFVTLFYVWSRISSLSVIVPLTSRFVKEPGERLIF